MTKRNLKIPRDCNFKDVGSGSIVEEAAVEYEDWAPVIQIIKFDDGEKALRFCYYLKDGKLARNALFITDNVIEDLRKEIKKSPQVKNFLEKLLE